MQQFNTDIVTMPINQFYRLYFVASIKNINQYKHDPYVLKHVHADWVAASEA